MWTAVGSIVGLLAGVALGAMFVLLRRRGEAQADRERAAVAESQVGQLKELLSQSEAAALGLRDQLDVERTARTAAVTRLEAETANLEQQKQLLASAEQRLVDVFKRLSADALSGSSENFLRMAGETLKGYVTRAEGVVGPLAETLKNLDAQVRDLEGRRQSAYGQLNEQLKSVAGTQQQLEAETRKLVAALSRPQARGQWGELTLRRVVEAAGMSEQCDFDEQASVNTDEGRLRPDMTINLPGGRKVVVDAKCPMEAYLEALAAEGEPARADALARHAAHLRQHMMQLAKKDYAANVAPTPEMVVLFVPGESFFSAALESDRDLIEFGAQRRVVLASPTTLIALLRAVAYGWQQEKLARNAERISALGRELYDRIRVVADHVGEAGRSLRQTVERFNKVIASLESRALVTARKFRELGAGSGDDIPAIDPIDHQVRELSPPPAEETPSTKDHEEPPSSEA